MVLLDTTITGQAANFKLLIVEGASLDEMRYVLTAHRDAWLIEYPRSTVLCERANGDKSDVSAVTPADRRTQVHDMKGAVQQVVLEACLAPLIGQGTEQQSPSQRAIACKHREADTEGVL